jgi:hypothetical protein
MYDIGDAARANCLAGGTCICGMGGDGAPLITMNNFGGDFNDQKVFGCGGAFQLASGGIGTNVDCSGEGCSSGGMAGFGFEQADSYYGWEGCCAVCGTVLQHNGLLSAGWNCQKDFFATGIWLRGAGL